jgi:hypothetical protein
MTALEAAAMLNRAGWYLMRERSIWYDKVPDAHGNLVRGPYYGAVVLLVRLASELRAGDAG